MIIFLSLRISNSLVIWTSSSFSFVNCVILMVFITLSETLSFLGSWPHSLFSTSSSTSHSSTSSQSSYSHHPSSCLLSRLLKISIHSLIIFSHILLLMLIIASLIFISISLIFSGSIRFFKIISFL